MPAASTAVLEFQQVSADGDFGLRCLDNSVVTITGQPRTAGKNVVKCKLTADVAASNVLSGSGTLAGTITSTSLEASGNSLLAGAFTDNATSSAHGFYYSGPSITNTTQVATVWLARGSGLNNRYVRVLLANTNSSPGITNGFYSDIDLQAGTAGTVTALGNGTATSVSITPVGSGYLIRMTGRVSTAATIPYFWIVSCAVAGTTTYAGNTTQNFIFDHVAIVTAASISDTTFNVDTDTGWLSGDAVCVASTTRTATECEIYPLNANAGASSFTSALYPFSGSVVSTHHGTAPIQAEIGLLTRNVKIRSTSPTLMSYVYCTALATVTASWAEFYYLGHTAAGKRGVEIDSGAVANPKSFTYCSLHDFDNNGLLCNLATDPSLNLVFSNNVCWLNYSGAWITLSSWITNTNWTFDSNLIMRCASYAFNLNDIGGVCTNNTVVGASTGGFILVETSSNVLGNFANNTVHSTTTYGLNVNTNNLSGTISSFTAWRNGGSGVFSNISATSNLTFTNLVLFGNATTAGSFYLSSGDTININGGLIAGDTSFAGSYGIRIDPSSATQLNLSNVDMSGTGSIYAPHTTNDFYLTNPTSIYPTGVINNCKFGAPNVLTAKTNWSKASSLGFQKYNQTSGDHRTEMTYGQLRTDSVVYHTAAPSMKMTPNNASNKLESAPKDKGMLVAVASGAAVTASVWVRKDATYFGAQPRLILRANAAIGVSADTVLAACSDLNSTAKATLDVASVGVTMSNGNLTATHTISTSNIGAASNPAMALSTGKVYFEMSVGVFVNSGSMVGLKLSTVSTFNSSDFYALGITFGGSNSLFSNGVDTGKTLGGPAAVGDVYGFAVDFTNHLAWVKRNATNWNGDPTANPVTGVGGVTIPVGAMIPGTRFAGGGTTETITANFGATALPNTPSGFAAGWTIPVYAGTATWVQLSGTTPTATDDGAVELIVDVDGTSGFVNIDDWQAS